MMPTTEKMSKAVMQTILRYPFYGALLVRLKVEEDRRGHPTMWTDGRWLKYNREFVDRLDFDSLIFILAHEVSHCALGHPYRRASRDQKIWNQACDHAVNLLLLKDPSLVAPQGTEMLADAQFEGMAAEEIYSALKQAEEEQQQAQQQAQQQQQEQQQQEQQQSGGEGGEGKGEQGDESSDQSPPEKDRQKPEPKEQREEKPDGDEGEVGEGDPENHDDEHDEEVEESAEEGEQRKDDGPEADSAGGEEEHEEESSGEEGGEQDLTDAPGTELGDVLDAGTGLEEVEGESTPMSEAEMKAEQESWECAAASAVIQAQTSGHLAAGAARQIRDTFAPTVDYGEYIKMFLQRLARDSESWNRPSRRSEGAGVYLPTLRSERVGKLVVAIDTSGSIGAQLLGEFAAELRAVQADMQPEEIVVLYCDAAVHGEQRFGPDDPIYFDEKQSKGGGGTSFVPVFAKVVEMQEEGEEIIGVVYLTDLDGQFPIAEEVEHIPTLWVYKSWYEKQVPFGEAVRIIRK